MAIDEMAADETYTEKATAKKLHRQFGHPNPEALIQLIKKAGIKNKRLIKEVRSISESCVTCLQNKKPSPRPVVCLPLAQRFNEMVGMDLKKWGDSYFLVMVDIGTRYCAAYVIHDKKPNSIIKAIFVSWITIFGAPQKFLSDNGGEFVNPEMRDLSESFNIRLLTTAAESPWSNGICERLNGILAGLVRKIMEDVKCGVQIALAWAVAARNAFYNKSGVSPNQLVFGFNPAFPNVYDDNAPGSSLENASTEIVSKNTFARDKAREIFIKYEANERIRKALRHNIRYSALDTIKVGDEVLYKRKEEHKWQGPGKVTHIDLAAKTASINHGGHTLKAHAVSILKCPKLNDEQSQQTESNDIDDIIDVQDIINEQRGDNGTDNDKKSDENDCQETIESIINGKIKRQVDQKEVTNQKVKKLRQNNNENNVETASSSHDHHETIENIIKGNIENQVDKKDMPNQKGKKQQQYNKDKDESIIDLANLKRGQRFQGFDSQTGEHISGKIINRAGKVKGSNKHCYNVERDNSAGWTGWINLENIQDLTFISDDTPMIILFNNGDVRQAKEKEIRNWIINNVFEEVEDEGQPTISVRWVITEKMSDGNSDTKARLVARGFEEQTSHLKKDSPTCAREVVRLTVCIASSKAWDCHTVDVKAAYLQGDEIKRDVYLQPPDEVNRGQIWKLKKTVYGLCDAARAWYIRVKSELLALGVTKSPLDNSLFFWHKNGVLEGVICVYVDDFLYCGTQVFVNSIIKTLMKKFKIGSSANITFTYVGIRVNSYQDGITMDQDHYIASLTAIPISKDRALEKHSELNKKEKQSFRALVGQLSWVSTHTRPDIAFETCELGGIYTTAKVTDLLRLNKLVERLKNISVQLYFPRLPTLENCTITCYTDASFRNLPNEGSQAGFIIFLESDTGHRRCPIYWQSRKIDRVVDSTLAAETLALKDGAKTAIYLAAIIKDMFKYAKIKVKCITDNKSLVDALYSERMLKDKWLRLHILGISDMIEKGEVDKVQWIDSKNQLADALTKKGICRDRLIHSISRG